MLRNVVAIWLFSAALAAAQPQSTSLRSHAPRLPNAILLMGDGGGFFFTHGTNDIPLDSSPSPRAPFISSRDGLILVGQDAKQQLAVYHLSGSKWATLQNQCSRMGAISPDDTTLACLDSHLSTDRRTVTMKLKFINLATGAEDPGPQIASGPGMIPTKPADLGAKGTLMGEVVPRYLDWSPDGEHIVFEYSQVMLKASKPIRTDASGYVVSGFDESVSSEIRIVDLATSSVRKLEDGYAPSWSPSGEWIAFSDTKIKQIFLVRPNGTDLHPVARLRKDYSGVQAVWSPDSSKLILNQWWDYENGSFATDLIDLDSSKSRRLIRNTCQVYRWLSNLP